MRLPEEYIKKMKRLLGNEYEDYLASLEQPMFHSLRVNTLKISVEDFLKISPFKLSPVPWTENAFYYDASVDTPSKHPFYYAGLFYLQEPSATLPAATIPIEEGDKVLDICSAPGGKSTELAAKLKDTGLLVSNDISASRLKALQKNIEIFGAKNVLITCETPEKLSETFTAYFDKILIDAPCSGEGMFRKSSSMISAWELNGNEKFVEIQKSILKEVVKMLKPGGKILYSTCTFDPREDEDQVEYLMSLDDSLRISSFPMHQGFEPGHSDWCSNGSGSAELNRTAHLFPHRINGEGHFVALLESDIVEADDSKVSGFSHLSPYKVKAYKGNEIIEDFLSHVLLKFERSEIEFNKDKLFYISKGTPDVRGLRIMRQGVYLGELKKNRFEPSQSLAMILKADEFDNVISLSSTSQSVYKYLKGDTLDLEEVQKEHPEMDIQSLRDGWILIAVEGFPLGFGKLNRGIIKNKYLPGWRMTS